MTKEDIAMNLVALYASYSYRCGGNQDYKKAVANAIMMLGIKWEDDIKENR